MRSLPMLLALGLLVQAPFASEAEEYNKRPFLDAGSQARVMNAIARAKAIEGRNELNQDGPRKCGEERGGVIVDKTPGGQRTVVVTKDIFNLGGTTVIESDCE